MDRYQFENAISAYIDNELGLAERQAFEAYVEANPEAEIMVNEIRATLQSMKSMPKIKASNTFMPNLYQRIEFEKNRPSKKIVERPSKTLFGFTPLYAGVMTVLVVSFITVGVNLWFVSNSTGQSAPTYTGSITEIHPTLKDKPNNNIIPTLVSNDAKVDSSDTTAIKKKQFNLNDKVKFVKDKR